jgi:hypothetical protein
MKPAIALRFVTTGIHFPFTFNRSNCIETLAPLPPPAGVTSKDASFDLGTAANRRAVWQWNVLRYLPVE